MVRLMAVVSNKPYTYHESVNLRGYPAVHAVNQNQPNRTLCGKDPEGWSWYDIVIQDINCKTCLRLMAKLAKRGNFQ